MRPHAHGENCTHSHSHLNQLSEAVIFGLSCRPTPAEAAVQTSQRATRPNIHRNLESLSCFRPKQTSSSYEPQSGFTIESVAHEIRSRTREGPAGSDSPLFAGNGLVCHVYYYSLLILRSLEDAQRCWAMLCDCQTIDRGGRDHSKCTRGGITASRILKAHQKYHRARPDSESLRRLDPTA